MLVKVDIKDQQLNDRVLLTLAGGGLRASVSVSLLPSPPLTASTPLGALH